MRKNLLSFCLLAVMFAAAGCGASPKSAAEDFLTALDNKDFETAKTFSTEGTHKMLDFLKGFADQMPEDTTKAEAKNVTKCVLEGDKGTCTYCCDEEGGDSELAMVKIDGEWKADMSKETLMGGEGALDGLGDDEPMIDEDLDVDVDMEDSDVTTEDGM